MKQIQYYTEWTNKRNEKNIQMGRETDVRVNKITL